MIMKSLKPIFLILSALFLTALLIGLCSVSFAQENPSAPQQEAVKGKSPKAESPEEMKKDYTERMEKFNKLYQHVQEREQKTHDVQMKNDLKMMENRMQQIRTNMENYENTKASMSPQQQEEARGRLHADMQSFKNTYEQMKSKYGEGKGKGKGKAPKKETKKTTEEQKEPAPDK